MSGMCHTALLHGDHIAAIWRTVDRLSVDTLNGRRSAAVYDVASKTYVQVRPTHCTALLACHSMLWMHSCCTVALSLVRYVRYCGASRHA